MENNRSLKKDYNEKQLIDAYNDDYWQKKYGVSAEDIKKVGDIGIQDKIISVNKNNKLFTADL